MWRVLRNLIAANPMGMFLWGLLAKWYILVAIPLLVIAFWTFKGFEEIGLIHYIFTETTTLLNNTKAIAQNCIPRLGKRGSTSTYTNLQDFWTCVGSPPAYDINKKFIIEKNGVKTEYETEEKWLEDKLKQDLDKLSPDGKTPDDFPYMDPHPIRNPYEPADTPPEAK